MKLVSIKICTQFVVFDIDIGHGQDMHAACHTIDCMQYVASWENDEKRKKKTQKKTRGAWYNKTFTIRFEIWFIKYLWMCACVPPPNVDGILVYKFHHFNFSLVFININSSNSIDTYSVLKEANVCSHVQSCTAALSYRSIIILRIFYFWIVYVICQRLLSDQLQFSTLTIIKVTDINLTVFFFYSPRFDKPLTALIFQ